LSANFPPEELKTHIRLVRKNHPVATIVGAVLLAGLIAVVIYYFKVIYPKI